MLAHNVGVAFPMTCFNLPTLYSKPEAGAATEYFLGHKTPVAVIQ